MILDVKEVINWGYNLRKLKAVRDRDILLNVAHGNVFTNERKHRYGIRLDPYCECGNVEDFNHKIFECENSKKLWSLIGAKGTELRNEIRDCLGANLGNNTATLEQIAEVMRKIKS